MGATSSLAQLTKSLNSGRIEPVYLFEGEEDFLHEEGIRRIDEAVFGGGDPGFDRDLLRGDEATLAEILDRASTYAMGGGRRLIVVRAAGRLPVDDAAGLKAYLANPNPKTCLVFSDPKLDRRKVLYRTLQTGAARVDCSPYDERRTTQWVREKLQARGFSISSELAETITAGLISDGLGRLNAELDKLIGSFASPREIEPDDLALLVNVPRTGDAFLLAQQILSGDRARAVTSLRALLAAGEEPVMLLGGMSWYFRNALKACVVRERRVNPHAAGERYGIDAWRAERFHREVGRVGSRSLRHAMRLCLVADREIKGGGSRDPAHAFERLIHRLGREPRSGA
ncbi:MAG TPA: DNA polymerase III subunit delta [Candidatus Polarisedimenticolia bacterium]|nr:DNA polymerase III subunit delta [Candidatus Polarisedimenticolia bacterium]